MATDEAAEPEPVPATADMTLADVATAFESFYRERWHDAARWGTALSGDVHSGEEAAQEAFLRIASKYGELERPEAYLRRTLVNVVHEAHRSSARRHRREQRTAQLTVAHGFEIGGLPDPELFTALDTLPAQQRAVLVLRYWADWDEAAIAEALGCRPATVRSLAKRGLDRLRTRLEERS